MEPFESFEYRGLTIELYEDEDPMTPAEWDTLGTMYQIGRADWRGFEPAEWRGAGDALERRGVALMVRYLRMAHGLIVAPFDVHDYGSNGALIRPADESDESCTGYIATDAARCEALGVDVADAPAALAQELEEWSSLFEGQVIGYMVRAGETVLDSCWSFYPDGGAGDGFEYVRDEARAAADYETRERERAARQGIPTL